METVPFVTNKLTTVVEHCIDEDYPISCIVLVKFNNVQKIHTCCHAVPGKTPSVLVIACHYVKQQQLLQTFEFDSMLRGAHKKRLRPFTFAGEDAKVQYETRYNDVKETLEQIYRCQQEYNIEYIMCVLENPPEIHGNLFEDFTVFDTTSEAENAIPICESLRNVFNN